MPGLTSSSYDPGDSSWQYGFSPSDNKLVCDVCRSFVRKSPGDAIAHLEWHERIGG